MYSQHCFFFSRFCCMFVYIIFQYIVRILCGTEPDDFSLLDYLSSRLKERTLFIPLQLERCLLLGLVLLINTQSGAVSGEDPTMLAVRRLKSHVRTTVCTGSQLKKFCLSGFCLPGSLNFFPPSSLQTQRGLCREL